jgi:hypothetical protein
MDMDTDTEMDMDDDEQTIDFVACRPLALIQIVTCFFFEHVLYIMLELEMDWGRFYYCNYACTTN